MGESAKADWALIKAAQLQEPALVRMMYKETGLAGAKYPAERERSAVADWLRRLGFDKARRGREERHPHISKRGRIVWIK